MYFKLDYKKKIKCPKLTLRTSGGTGVGILQLGGKPYFELNANDISTLKFTIYEKLDGKPVPYYDMVTQNKLIETERLGVYRITEIDETRTGKVAYKEVVAKSREYELKQRKIFDISGVFSLYNVADTDSSLMHIICSSLGNWTIGHIDNELQSLWRTFDVDSTDAYSLLAETLSTSFECIFQYDTYNRTISAYTVDNFGEKVNVLLSYRNLVQQNIISTTLDDVYTVFRVRGGDDLDIRAVNPTGLNTISNFDAFMIPVSEGGDASDNLVTAWETYKAKYVTLTTTQMTNVSLLKTYYAELSELNNKVPSTVTTDWTQYGLVELNVKKSTYEVLQSTLLSNGAGSTSSSQYSEYSTTVNTLNAILAQITIRQNQIAAKQNQITELESSISNVASQLSMSSNFTSDQIKELYSFYRETDYVDETYVVAEDAADEEELEVKQQLFDVATKELARVSQPQYNIETTLNNLFMLPEFSGYYEDFKLGNIITIKFSNTYIATARLLSIKIDFDKIEDLSVVFSNRNKLDNSAIDFAKISAQASATSNTVSVGGIGWDKAASKTSAINEYMTSALNVAVQEIKSSDEEEITWGEYGLRLRKKDKITGTYLPYESWLVANQWLMSDDNFQSAKIGIGNYTDGNGNKYYGIMAPVIYGNMMLTSALTISNENNTITMNKNGATFTNCDITIIKGTNTLTLNATDGIKLTKSGVSQFYIDGSGNATFAGIINGGSININNGVFTVNSSGALTSTSGTIGGWSIGSSSLTSPTSRMKLSGSGMNLYNSYGSYLGGIAATASTDGGVVLVKSSAAAYLAIATTDDTNPDDGMSVSLNVLYTPNAVTIGSTSYESGFHFRFTPIYIDFGGLKATDDIETDGYLRAGVEVTAPTGSFTNLYINGSLFNSSSYVTTSTFSGHSHSSANLYASYGGGAIDIGSVQACGFIYANSTFQTKSSSDERLKYDFKSLEELPIELFLELKPKQFKFKDGCNSYHSGIIFGFIAQDIEATFLKYGLNVWDYDLIYKTPINTYTDERLYIEDEVYRINYENFHAWEVLVIQKLWSKIVS